MTYTRRSTLVRARQDSVLRRLQELLTDVCVTGNVCSETNLEKDSHVEESSMLQVCAVEEAKFPELQFSRVYALDNFLVHCFSLSLLRLNPFFIIVLAPFPKFFPWRRSRRHASQGLSGSRVPDTYRCYRLIGINITYRDSVKALLPFDFMNTSSHSTCSFYTCLLSIGYSP